MSEPTPSAPGAPGRLLRCCCLLAVLCAASAAEAATASVRIDNFTFTPGELTVAPGTTVTWTNADDIPHIVAATDRSFKSKPLDTDGQYSFTFTTAGEFGYFCSLHPHMTGKILVKAP